MDVDHTTGLVLTDRKIGETALQRLFCSDNYTVVKLSELRLDKVIKQAVGMVIFGRGRSRPAVSARESGILYFITDLKGNTGSLELFHDAKQKFRGVPGMTELEGTVIFLLDPKVMSDPQRPETLLFKMSRQQDIVIIGKCSTFSKCDGIRKDGKSCTMPVDTSDSTRCKYHQERSELQLNGIRNPLSAVPARSTAVPPKSVSIPPSVSASSLSSSSSSSTSTTLVVDFLQQALQPDTLSSSSSRRGGTGTSQALGSHKSSAICPQEDAEDEDEEDTSLDTRVNAAADEIGKGRGRPDHAKAGVGAIPVHASVSVPVSAMDRKDGSVAVPKESVVFKALSEKYYDNRAKENIARVTANALQQTTSSSRVPVPPSGTAGAGAGGSNGLLRNRHTGATRHNNLVAQNQKRKLDQSVMDKIHQFSKLRCVGGDLFDIDQARKNANKPNLKKQAELRSAQEIKSKQLDVDIEALLKRESSHIQEAEDDAFKSQMTRLEALSKREFMVQKDEKVHSLTVRANHCLTCNEVSESSLERCRKQGHTVNTVSVIKRFYECVNCEQRESTLGGAVRLPKHACLRCSEYKWRPCGKRKTGFETSSRGAAADRLVVSMAEGTARADVNRIAGAKSVLDYTK